MIVEEKGGKHSSEYVPYSYENKKTFGYIIKPTHELRWFLNKNNEKILQQKWVDNEGNEEWKAIEIVEE